MSRIELLRKTYLNIDILDSQGNVIDVRYKSFPKGTIIEVLPEWKESGEVVDCSFIDLICKLTGNRIRHISTYAIKDLDRDMDLPSAISWSLRRLFMAEIMNLHIDEEATFGTALESLQSGYKPFEEFDVVAAEQELRKLISWFDEGEETPCSFMLTDKDWEDRALCNDITAYPIREKNDEMPSKD